MTPHPIPEDFSLTPATQNWMAREYPQLDEAKTLEVFKNKMANAIDYEKRSPYYGQQVHALNWQKKFQTYVRIAMVNKWSGSIVPKPNHEIDYRWQEALTHAKAIGCPEQRRPSDTVESFNARVKMWETRPSASQKIIDFGQLKQMVK